MPFQSKLHIDFGYDDDYVIKMLEQSMEELKKSKLDLPPAAQPNEFPKRPFGVFQEPNFEAKVCMTFNVTIYNCYVIYM